MSSWIIPPEQGFTPGQTLAITGKPYFTIIEAPQKESLSGSPQDDMIFNNTGETMIFNNTAEIMEFN